MNDYLKIKPADDEEIYVVLAHKLDDNRRSMLDLTMFNSAVDQYAIEYGGEEELTLTLDFNHLYVEFTDINGIEHKVELL